MDSVELMIKPVMEQFFSNYSWRILDIDLSEMNNTTRFIEAQEKVWVLRIYETHSEKDKVCYEHAVLKALAEMPKEFNIPKPMLTPEGNTFVYTDLGKIASVFHYLDGVNPNLQDTAQLYEFGKAVAQLTLLLAKAQVDNGPVYRPYYELENTHPSCSLDKVVQFCKAPPAGFTKHRQELEAIAEQIVVFKDKVSQLIELPHQLVHGDLNASNVLADSQGHISAILDFEFVTIDLRVMELAVCLSDLIQPEQEEQGKWTRIESLITGYGSLMELTKGEIEVVPILVQLRRLDVFIHFLGRYWDGIDQPDVLEQQIVSTATNTRWLTLYQNQLCALLKRRIVQEQE